MSGSGAAAAPRRIALISEVMTPPWDEGIRIFALQLLRHFTAAGVHVLPIAERAGEADGIAIEGTLANRWFVSRKLRASLRRFAPEVILYIPWTSLTARTLARVRVLGRYGRAPVTVLALQPRPADAVQRIMARFAPPELVLCCGPGAESQARALRLAAARVPGGVDLERFRPLPPPLRERLRERAQVKPGDFVVLHVGHLKVSRNVDALAAVAGVAGVRAMLVASTSTPPEQEAAARLRDAGVTVMTHHQDRIEVVYQLADAYLFPVTSALDAIEIPLSVLEAAACDLPIVTTRYGALPEIFTGAEEAGVLWADTPSDAAECVRGLLARRATPPATGARRPLANGARRALADGARRALVAGFGWDRAAARVLDALGRIAGRSAG